MGEENIPNYEPPRDYVTEEMVRYASEGVTDYWHIAQNLNAMMQDGYCRICGLVPAACKRGGCGHKKRS